MVEELDDTGRIHDHHGDGTSGLRGGPWLGVFQGGAAGGPSPPGVKARPRSEPRGRSFTIGGPRDKGRVAEAGARVLARFDRLTREDREGVLQAAADRLARSPVPEGPTGEARVAHTVLCEAISVDLRRWVDEIKAPHAQVAHELTLARRRAAMLTGREQRVFVTVCALDDAADGDEAGKVVLRAAVAFQMRWNTAHQNVSRAWRKICDKGALAAWCGDWRAGHRFVCGAPSFELWQAARTYMAACSGRDGHGGEAFQAWVKAHETHNAWFNEWKKQSARATRRWRELMAVLDASPLRPGALHAPLVQRCEALGIDRWVVPAKLGQQSWRDLLEAAHRPTPPARAAWISFLREHGFGDGAEAAFRELEGAAALADVASVELENAYKSLLGAAEGQPSASVRARDELRALVEAGAGR